MKIGQYQLANNVFLAPMVGVTDLPFRQIARRYGAGLAVGEMTAADPAVRYSSKSRYRRVHLQEHAPRSIQIVGYDPGMMADAAQFNEDQGASIIDINMGCPAKKVCRRAAGSALLADEKLVESILKAVIAAVSVPVTLKIRTGTTPINKNGVSVARIAQQCGVSALVVHGRTRACMFKGEAEYDTIKQIKQAVHIPVVANGDLTSEQKVREVLEYTCADAAMIGRGSYGQPWFVGQVAHFIQTGEYLPAPDMLEQREVISEHLQGLYSLYGKTLGVKVARKHIKWYIARHLPQSTFLKDIVRVDDAQVQLNKVSVFYKDMAQGLLQEAARISEVA